VTIVITPVFDASLHTTGHLDAKFDASGEVHSRFGVRFSSSDGFSTSKATGSGGTGSYGGELTATARAAFEPRLRALLFGDEDAGVSATLAPYVQLDADPCTVSGTSGVDLDLAVKLAVLHHTVVDKSTNIPVIESELFKVHLRDCAYWSGGIDYAASLDEYVGDSHRTLSSSTHLAIDPVTAPPGAPYYGYDTSGTATGTRVEDTLHPEGCGGGGAEWHEVWTDKWDAIPHTDAAQDPTPRWQIGQLSPGHYYLNGDVGYLLVPWHRTIDSMRENIPAGTGCTATHDDTISSDSWQETFGVIQHDGDTTLGTELDFTVDETGTHATGTRSFPQSANTAGVTVTWDLTKHCMYNVTEC
jgi:hypothetical protein